MTDYVIRATGGEGQVRAFIATTTEMVEESRRLHSTSKVATAALGRTLTATSIMGLMMKNQGDKVTVIIKGGGPIGTILATSNVKGTVKGYVEKPNVEVPNYENGKLNVAAAVGNDGVVKVIKDLGLREPYNGAYPLVSGEIAEDFTHYFALSEQTPSIVALGVLTTPIELDNNGEEIAEDEEYEIDLSKFKVEHAGGLIVQLMPDATEETICQLEKNVSQLTSVTNMMKEGKTPEDILNIVLEGLNPKILDKANVGFECECSHEKGKEVLVSIGKHELAAVVEEDKKAEIGCQFCNSKYTYTEEELLEMLKEM
ncbi:Hsp33 family molecular chaperone HslO [Romboutsia sp.]|uniref:Hsp33 family molecular chaperone HslO n=1 Tax=Romboutsia sp. TaxID=1965302 RepID=UPI003F4142D5